MRVIQLSDCHLQADTSRPYRSVDASENLANVMRKVQMWGPDVVLLTGDLREDDSSVVYERIAALLGDACPVLALPGNHDDPSVMKKWFPLGPWDGVFCHHVNEWAIMLMDSTVPGRVEGALSDETLSSLEAALDSSDSEFVLIALHHQPVPVGSPWIDRWPLTAPERFLDIVDRESRIHAVVWGHIHQKFSELRGSIQLLGSPSTAANTRSGTRHFDHDPRGPGCRWLILEPGGGVKTDVLYADGSGGV